jgi:hypothetical protein
MKKAPKFKLTNQHMRKDMLVQAIVASKANNKILKELVLHLKKATDQYQNISRR